MKPIAAFRTPVPVPNAIRLSCKAELQYMRQRTSARKVLNVFLYRNHRLVSHLKLNIAQRVAFVCQQPQKTVENAPCLVSDSDDSGEALPKNAYT